MDKKTILKRAILRVPLSNSGHKKEKKDGKGGPMGAYNPYDRSLKTPYITSAQYNPPIPGGRNNQ